MKPVVNGLSDRRVPQPRHRQPRHRAHERRPEQGCTEVRRTDTV